MIVLDDISFDPDPEEVFVRLRLNPSASYAAEIVRLVESATCCARPRALYKVARVERTEVDRVIVAERGRHEISEEPATAARQVCFVSRVVRINLDTAERLFPFVATCGPELDSIPLPPGDVFSQYCHDTLKEMALSTAFAHLSDHLKESYGLGTLSCLSPGAGDEQLWPIEQQQELFGFLGDVEGRIGVSLTNTCLMIPNKSVSGIFYPCDHGFESCQLYRRETCHYRRAPFDPQLWQEIIGTE